MQLLIRNVRIIDPGSPLHGQTHDIFIEDGIIRKIGTQLQEPDARLIEAENLHVSAGWVDVFAHFCDPGEEYKEDILSGSAAAAAGGFTEVMILPDTHPPLQSKSQVEYVLNKARDLPVQVYPIGAVSRDLAGESLAEMYEMHLSGAVAFSDGLHPVQSAGLLLKALQYVRAFDGVIIQVPDNTSISKHGQMNEGIHSTRLGMPGIPAIAEEIQVQRDLELAQYTDSRIHFTGISTGKAADLIRQAKKAGIKVTCSVTPYHLLLTDAALRDYDSNFKVNPPLRTPEDAEALRQAVNEGVIDCFATHHMPQDWDSKEKEFEYAREGMIGLQSCFGLLNEALPEMPLERKIAMLSSHPRRIFGLPNAAFTEGAPANLTLFDPSREWTFEEKDIRSRSRNTPFAGATLTGKALGIIHKKTVYLNS